MQCMQFSLLRIALTLIYTGITTAMVDITTVNSVSTNQCARPDFLQPSPSNDYAHNKNADNPQNPIALEFSPSSTYHDLVLITGEKDSETEKTYKSLIASFRAEGRCGIAQHVRNIIVQKEIPSEDLLLILDTIHTCSGYLQTLHWNTSSYIATPVLDVLQTTRFPDLKIHVKVLDRASAPFHHRRMNNPLLASPRLTSLTYQLFVRGYQANVPTLSEWPILTRCLEAAQNLKVLRLEVRRDDVYDGPGILGSYSHDSVAPRKLARLDLRDETRLPSLEELVIREQRYHGPSTYLWDAEHCDSLLNAADWSNLVVLDLGPDLPVAFFKTFTSRVPGLKKLGFGFDRETTSSDLQIVESFMENVTGLEGLDVSQPSKGIDTLWPAILKHKSTMKQLVLRPSHARYYDPEYINISRVEEVTRDFPKLERLGWDVPLLEGNVDPAYLSLFSQISNLRHLDLFLRLPTSSTPYSPAQTFIPNTMGEMSAPPLDVSSSRAAAIEIMEVISAKHDKPLERLTMHFSRTGYGDRMETYLMMANLQVRRGRNGGYECRGKGEWSGMSSLEEELWLEGE